MGNVGLGRLSAGHRRRRMNSRQGQHTGVPSGTCDGARVARRAACEGSLECARAGAKRGRVGHGVGRGRRGGCMRGGQSCRRRCGSGEVGRYGDSRATCLGLTAGGLNALGRRNLAGCAGARAWAGTGVAALLLPALPTRSACCRVPAAVRSDCSRGGTRLVCGVTPKIFVSFRCSHTISTQAVFAYLSLYLYPTSLGD